MKIKNIGKTTSLFLLIISSLGVSQTALPISKNSKEYLKSNLEFLASDELEGREITTRGEKLAGLFIAEELQKYGVLPFGDNGTYFQEFIVEVSGIKENSGISFLTEEENPPHFKNGEGIVYSPHSLPSKNYNNKEYEVIFVGYGIYSEDDNYNSYENIEVEGKVVLLLNGIPNLNGDEVLADSIVSKYRRSSAKSTLAYSKGAVGVMVLPNAQTFKYWKYYQSWANSRNYKLEEEIDKTLSADNIPTVILDKTAAETLLKNEEQNYKDLSNLVDPKPESFLLNSKVKFEYDVILENRKARNVIGLIKGKNTNLKKEYLSIGAHYDHEGIKGDQIYNGADDNGSGTVTILEVARRLAFSNENERPIIVIFHTGEEKGLKGSKYLAHNSDFIDDVIVHINTDMVGRESEDSIYCVGASKISSELGKIVETSNSESSNFVLNYKFDDPKDPQKLYYRSDHIHYANNGIPIVFFYDYMKKDYHKPSDTVDKINFTKMVKMTELIYSITIKISNLDHKLSVNK